MKSALYIFVASLLIGCGTGSGKNDDTSSQASECDGSVIIENVIPAESSEPSEPEDEDTSTEPEGCELSPICRALRAANEQGLQVVDQFTKLDGSTIIVTCGGEINLGGDGSGNVTTNISGQLPEE